MFTDAIDLLVAAKYEVVVYNRRGHENKSLYFSIVGDPYMTEIVLAAIARERPGRGLFLLGFSAGTGAIARYAQDLAMKRRSSQHEVRFASMISPGYTTDFDVEANLWAMSWVIWSMNRMFLTEINITKFPEVVKRLWECKEIKKWIEIAGELSGHGTIESYREHCCPGYNWPILKSWAGTKLNTTKYFPSVVFSARDDILFPWEMVRKYEFIFRMMHSLALIDTDHGGHCTYMDNKAGSWAVRMSIRMFDQVVKNSVGESAMGEKSLDSHVLI